MIFVVPFPSEPLHLALGALLQSPMTQMSLAEPYLREYSAAGGAHKVFGKERNERRYREDVLLGRKGEFLKFHEAQVYHNITPPS
jgi:hypothetical protein